MANTAGLCQSFKKELLNGVHAFGTTNTRAGTGADAFYGALYYSTSTLAPTTTTAYTATGEITASGTYTASGTALTNATAPNASSGVAYWTPSANLSWTSFSATNFDTLLIYNTTVTGKPAVGIFTFSNQTIASGTFTLTMPANDTVSGLIRLA
jgi:hypothetical protein